MEESGLSLKEKNTQDWCSYFQITHKYKHYFMTDPLIIIFGDFGIW